MEEKQKEHKGLYWPRYIEKKWRDRTLAYVEELDDGSCRIVTEHGLPIVISSVEELITTMFAHNLLLFTTQLVRFRHLHALIDLGCAIYCLETGKPISCCIAGSRNTKRWIVQIDSWGYAVPSSKVLQELRATYDFCKVGTPSTPGALGQALMRASWKRQFGDTWYEEHRHRRPPGVAVKELREHSTGARSDLIQKDVVNLPSAIEIDQKNAYAHHFREQPTGPCYPTWKESARAHLIYWAETRITITRDLALGCFPIRGEDVSLSYPTEAGTVYTRHSWGHEVSLMEQEGCYVEFTGKGWAWDEMTEDPAGWVTLMQWLRDHAPSPEVERHIKHAIVAGIGRHNLPDERYMLVSGDRREEGDRVASARTKKGGLEAYDYYIHMEMNHSPDTLPHWFFYTQSLCRLSLYREAKKWALQGKLLATNTDAVIVTADADVSSYVAHSDAQSGDWCAEVLTHVSLPELRHLISDQKIRRPGVSRKKKVV